ncbi:probable D-2-hydroxyacid dehydrogenase protein [Lentisphaera araneosa HTCC2155]|uniref:Probable D-2-hydroxyacid dehydrogenase protein n=1 Tax=Lentisphaera araneosa HTCC2155 TaxID=313628 RepID=A6DQY5_9BACT|nr:hydroxyacid dehydrogenase [Lentisphaera araneosa]EDM26035.1 probable D-2-hydroxyacid dehydrogenase protein [Lentisphaera araneosa HTCC2155]
MYESLLIGTPVQINRIFTPDRRETISKLSDLYPEVIKTEDLAKHSRELSEVKYVFSTWGPPLFTDEQLAQLPNLEAVFYAAGSVKDFCDQLFKHQIKIFSAPKANAVPVAQFALGQILLCLKNYFQDNELIHKTKSHKDAYLYKAPGIFNESVGIIGAGEIGRVLINLLKNFDVNILVVDPCLDKQSAQELGVEICTLEEVFKRAYVVSNHLPNIPATQKMITAKHFSSMRNGATFINTGRGAQVCEDGLVEALSKRTDLYALLDVTCEEPPNENSPLYQYDNIKLTGHIAGSLGNEVVRMADFVIADFKRYLKNEKTLYQVDPKTIGEKA